MFNFCSFPGTLYLTFPLAIPLCEAPFLKSEPGFLLAVFDEEFHLAVVRHAYTPDFLRGVPQFFQSLQERKESQNC